jgi:structural maintenance of chromosome 4
MKPKAMTPNDQGLLEYLEEIIGSSAHVEEIEQLAKMVEMQNEKKIE